MVATKTQTKGITRMTDLSIPTEVTEELAARPLPVEELLPEAAPTPDPVTVPTAPAVRSRRYKKRPDPVMEAEVFDGHVVPSLAEGTIWTIIQSSTGACQCQIEAGARVLALDSGDYLIRDGFGNLTSMKPDRFEAQFEPE